MLVEGPIQILGITVPRSKAKYWQGALEWTRSGIIAGDRGILRLATGTTQRELGIPEGTLYVERPDGSIEHLGYTATVRRGLVTRQITSVYNPL